MHVSFNRKQRKRQRRNLHSIKKPQKHDFSHFCGQIFVKAMFLLRISDGTDGFR